MDGLLKRCHRTSPPFPVNYSLSVVSTKLENFYPAKPKPRPFTAHLALIKDTDSFFAPYCILSEILKSIHGDTGYRPCIISAAVRHRRNTVCSSTGFFMPPTSGRKTGPRDRRCVMETWIHCRAQQQKV